MEELGKFKKNFINLKNSLENVDKSLEQNQWIIDFSVVKTMAIWEELIRYLADKELEKIKNIEDLKICLDRGRYHEFIWKSWCDNKQEGLLPKSELDMKDIKKYRELRNKIAHGFSRENTELVDIENFIKKSLRLFENIV